MSTGPSKKESEDAIAQHLEICESCRRRVAEIREKTRDEPIVRIRPSSV
jgi:hypothetical protein